MTYSEASEMMIANGLMMMTMMAPRHFLYKMMMTMKPDIIENKMTIRPSALMTPPLAQFTGYQTCTMCTLRAIIHQTWIEAVKQAST